jgi:hypothetical protein
VTAPTTGPRPGSTAEALEGATGDYGVSGDAMRWSPDLAAGCPAELAREAEPAGVRRRVTLLLVTLTRGAVQLLAGSLGDGKRHPATPVGRSAGGTCTTEG